MTDAANAPAPTPAATAEATAAAAAAALAAKPAATGADAELLIGDDTGEAGKPPVINPKGDVTVEFNPTGDAGLDMALGFIGKLGIGPGNAAFDAAEKGDFSMLRAHLGGMGAKAAGFDGYIKLAEQAFEKGKEKATGAQAKTTEAIHSAVGGADQWKAIQTWAGKEATAEEKKDVNAALRAGGTQAKAMALWLAEKYRGAKGTTVEPKRVADPSQSKPGAAVEGGPLSAKDYANATQKARATLGYKFEGSPQYAALQARRLAGQRAGL